MERKRGKSVEKGHVQLYTLEVFLLSGPMTEIFAKKNPVISRILQIRGDQTLAACIRPFEILLRGPNNMRNLSTPFPPRSLRLRVTSKKPCHAEAQRTRRRVGSCPLPFC
jgi:hypothetical protein